MREPGQRTGRRRRSQRGRCQRQRRRRRPGRGWHGGGEPARRWAASAWGRRWAACAAWRAPAAARGASGAPHCRRCPRSLVPRPGCQTRSVRRWPGRRPRQRGSRRRGPPPGGCCRWVGCPLQAREGEGGREERQGKGKWHACCETMHVEPAGCSIKTGPSLQAGKHPAGRTRSEWREGLRLLERRQGQVLLPLPPLLAPAKEARRRRGRRGGRRRGVPASRGRVGRRALGRAPAGGGQHLGGHGGRHQACGHQLQHLFLAGRRLRLLGGLCRAAQGGGSGWSLAAS